MEDNQAKRGGLVSLERVNGSTASRPGKPYVGIAYFCLACALRSPPPSSTRGQKRTDIVKHYKDVHEIELSAEDERAALGVRARTSVGKMRLFSAATWNLLRPPGAPAACQRSTRDRNRAEGDSGAASEDEDEDEEKAGPNLNEARGGKRPRYPDDGGDRRNAPHGEATADHTQNIIQLQKDVANLHTRVEEILQYIQQQQEHNQHFSPNHQRDTYFFQQQHHSPGSSAAALYSLYPPPICTSASTTSNNATWVPTFAATSRPRDMPHWPQNVTLDRDFAAELSKTTDSGMEEESLSEKKSAWAGECSSPLPPWTDTEHASLLGEFDQSTGSPGFVDPTYQAWVSRGKSGGPIVHLSSDLGGGDFRPLTNASASRVGNGQQQGTSLLPTFPHDTRLKVAIECPNADSYAGLELQWADDAGKSQTLQWRSPDTGEVIKAAGDALRDTVPVRLCHDGRDGDCVEELRLVRSSTATPSSASAAPPVPIWRWGYRIKSAHATAPTTGDVANVEGGVHPVSPRPTGGCVSPPEQEGEKEEGATEEAKASCPQIAIKEEQVSNDQEPPPAIDGALVAKGQHGAGEPLIPATSTTSADDQPLLVARPIEVETVERFGNRGYNAVRVLAIGVNEYHHAQTGMADLKGAEEDAKEVGGLFRRQGAHVVTLVGRDATEARVREALLGWRESAGPRDLLVVYFSGHGRLLVSDPSTGATAAGICLHGYDGRGGGFIRTTHLWDWVCESRSGHKLMIFDCCYPAHGLLRPRGTGRSQRWRSLVRHHAAQVLAAAAPNDLAYERAESGRTRGVFTSHLVRGLSGAAFGARSSSSSSSSSSADRVWITLDELAAWVRDQVLQDTGQSVHHGYVADRASDRGQVIFVRPDAALPMVSDASSDESDSNSDQGGCDGEGRVTTISQTTREPLPSPGPASASQGAGTILPTSSPVPIVNSLLGVLGAIGAFSQKRSTIRNDHQHTVLIKSEKNMASDPFGNDDWITTAPNQVEPINRSAADFGVQIKCPECSERPQWTGRLVSGTETSVSALTSW